MVVGEVVEERNIVKVLFEFDGDDDVDGEIEVFESSVRISEFRKESKVFFSIDTFTALVDEDIILIHQSKSAIFNINIY